MKLLIVIIKQNIFSILFIFSEKFNSQFIHLRPSIQVAKLEKKLKSVYKNYCFNVSPDKSFKEYKTKYEELKKLTEGLFVLNNIFRIMIIELEIE